MVPKTGLEPARILSTTLSRLLRVQSCRLNPWFEFQHTKQLVQSTWLNQREGYWNVIVSYKKSSILNDALFNSKPTVPMGYFVLIGFGSLGLVHISTDILISLLKIFYFAMSFIYCHLLSWRWAHKILYALSINNAWCFFRYHFIYIFIFWRNTPICNFFRRTRQIEALLQLTI